MADHEEIEEVDEERQDEEIDKSGGGEEEEWKRYANMSLEEKRKYYTCRDSYIQLEDIETWPNYYQHNGYKFSKIQTFKIGKPPHKVDAKINDKVSLYVGDITKLEIDAIVNAANKSLLGGGGVDGCIHRAAGHTLVEECCLLNGCETGEAKITSGHRLPAKYVIHTVGPIGKNEKALKSCYENCLNVALENDVKTLAFCCISTGIYGYPNKDAAEVALRTTRKWLENQSNANGIDRIIFCLFLDKDIKIYESLMLKYFPPGERERSNRKTKEGTKALTKTEKDKEPEAEKVPEDEDKDKEKQDEDVKEEEERKSPEDKDKEKQDEDVKEEEKRKSPEDSEKLDVELETKPQETGETEKPNDKKEEKRTTTTEEMEIHEKLDEDNEKRLEKRAEYQEEELAKGTNDEEKEGSDGVVVPKPKKQKQESEPNDKDVEMTNEDLQLRQRQEIEKKEEKVAQEENEQMEVEDSSGKQDKEVEDVVMRSKEKQVEETEESSEKQQDSEKEPPKQFETYV